MVFIRINEIVFCEPNKILSVFYESICLVFGFKSHMLNKARGLKAEKGGKSQGKVSLDTRASVITKPNLED